MFEGREASFPQFGINVSVLEPGKPNCLYHSEAAQEAFLVLSGECKLLVEGEERALKAWDFFHCPPGVEHVFVGAGDGPCVVLMVGARSKDERLLYPVSELAGRYDATRISSARRRLGRRTGPSFPGPGGQAGCRSVPTGRRRSRANQPRVR